MNPILVEILLEHVYIISVDMPVVTHELIERCYCTFSR
jgi:molybdopterin-guanine dinucleotide biosynthesis protein A